MTIGQPVQNVHIGGYSTAIPPYNAQSGSPVAGSAVIVDPASGLDNAPSSAPVYKIAGGIYPKGGTSADIQAALDWIKANGGGRLNLVPFVTYVATTPMTVDVHFCEMVGQNSTIDATGFSGSGPVLNITSSGAPPNQYQHLRLPLGNHRQ